MYAEAIAEFQKSIAISGRSTFLVAALGHACAVSGNRGEAMKILEELSELSKQRYVAPYFMAVIHKSLGENDQAFEWLEKAYEERSNWLVFLKVEPRLDTLRADPRFQDLLRRVGLPP